MGHLVCRTCCIFFMVGALLPAVAQEPPETLPGERPVLPETTPPAAPGAGPCQRLPAPRQTAPRAGTKFHQIPRTTYFGWAAVENAASYGIEVDCMHCCVQGRWCSDVGMTWHLKDNLTATEYAHDFVGAQPGRWRVWAFNSCSGKGRLSGWWEFEYTR